VSKVETVNVTFNRTEDFIESACSVSMACGGMRIAHVIAAGLISLAPRWWGVPHNGVENFGEEP